MLIKKPLLPPMTSLFKKKPSTKDQLNEKEARLIPETIVEELDKHIISQADAKRAVAIALRNRYRRRQVTGDLQDEIYPKNILMIGNTGIGKTEIARRLAKLTEAPFIKVEATKFSQIGYVGRDVESIIRDLITHAVNQERSTMLKALEGEAEKEGEERILDALLPESASASGRKPPPTSPKELEALSLSLSLDPRTQQGSPSPQESTGDQASGEAKDTQFRQTREKLRVRLQAGELEDRSIEVMLTPNQPPPGGVQISGINLMDQQMEGLQNMMKNVGDIFKNKQNKERMPIREARPRLIAQVAESMLDMNQVVTIAKEKTENMGMVFIDEIDKIVAKGEQTHNSMDVSREGVQRDILPLVEGSVVSTQYGMIATDHILFIAAGAFHISSPSDMIPELQGRFPIRVKLVPLKADEMERILTEPKSALTKQYQALLQSEGITLEFKKDAIHEIATTAERVNAESENIGARRLATLMEKLLEELLFYGGDKQRLKEKTSLNLKGSTVTIDAAYVKMRFQDILPDKDLRRYIL